MLDRLEKIVKEHFGVTDELAEAGYILSDGSMIDFSGRRYVSGYIRKGDRFVPKRGPDRIFGRNLDHRQLPEKVADLMGSEPGGELMRRFMEKTGALRVSIGTGFSVYKMPSVEAVSSFVREWRQVYGYDRSIVVDALDAEHGGVIQSQEIEHPTVEKIMDFLESAFSHRPSLGALRFKKGPKDWSPSGHIPWMPIWPEFVDGYLEAALFSSADESDESGGRPLDERFTVQDFDQETINKAVKDCNDFIKENRKDLEPIDDKWDAGRDFWFTRNRHGIGYWDGDYEEELGERLTESAHQYGERHVDVEGKKLHIYG